MRKKYERTAEPEHLRGKKTVKINDFVIISETEKAWLLRKNAADKSEKAFWVPKSQCHLHSHATNRRLHDLEIVRTIAEEKGLLDGEPDQLADKSIMDEFDQLIAERYKK